MTKFELLSSKFRGIGVLFAVFPATILLIGQGSCSQDADGDGWTVEDGDCDDNDSSVFPGATEECDGVDNDCDGEIDEGMVSEDTAIYDNLGSNDTYTSYGDWLGNMSGQWVVEAGEFTPEETGVLQELDLAMFAGTGSNEFTLKILDDSDGEPGTEVLWEATFNDYLGSYGSVVYLDGLDGPTLEAGTSYWLYAEAPEDGSTYFMWYYNDKEMLGCKARMDAYSSSGWSTSCDYEQLGMRIIVGPGDCG